MNEADIKSLQTLYESKELMFRILETFPVPVEIFSADGTTVFVNRAFLDLNGIEDSNSIVGKYNLLKEIEGDAQLRLQDGIQRAFDGETVLISEFTASAQDYVDLGIVKEKPFEAAVMDAHLCPVYLGTAQDSGELCYVVCVLIIKSIYRDKSHVINAKKYIDLNWQKKFDPKALALALNMSVNQLYLLFKRGTGITPGEYYKNIKLERLKEKLSDKNLSVKEAFAVCGVNSQGRFARVFKAKTGFSPSAWRKQCTVTDDIS